MAAKWTIILIFAACFQSSSCEEELKLTKRKLLQSIFTCTSAGVFPDESVDDCSRFFKCSFMGRRFFRMAFICSSSLSFDPSTGMCSSTYVCPTMVETTTTTTTTIATTSEPFFCRTIGKFPNTRDCSSYFNCISIGDGLIQISYTCSNGNYDPELKQCSTSYVCPFQIESNPCTEQGKFADLSKSGCTGYYQCMAMRRSWFKLSYTCPESQKFNPVTQSCESTYQCPECTEEGKFEDQSTPDCNDYYQCLKSGNYLYKINHKCSVGFKFNPSTLTCSKSYLC